MLTIPSWKAVEQSIQTVVTYSVDSSDLRQGCILVDDDNDNDYQCDSPEIMAYVKQEEVTLKTFDWLSNKLFPFFRKNTQQINKNFRLVSIHCQLIVN